MKHLMLTSYTRLFPLTAGAAVKMCKGANLGNLRLALDQQL